MCSRSYRMEYEVMGMVRMVNWWVRWLGYPWHHAILVLWMVNEKERKKEGEREAVGLSSILRLPWSSQSDPTELGEGEEEGDSCCGWEGAVSRNCSCGGCWCKTWCLVDAGDDQRSNCCSWFEWQFTCCWCNSCCLFKCLCAISALCEWMSELIIQLWVCACCSGWWLGIPTEPMDPMEPWVISAAFQAAAAANAIALGLVIVFVHCDSGAIDGDVPCNHVGYNEWQLEALP